MFWNILKTFLEKCAGIFKSDFPNASTFVFLEKNVVVGNRIKEKTTKYFSELDNQTIQNLLNLYKVDFEMFNYSFEIQL